ncbi:MAG: hypothetical protein INR69_03535 [Mucilaginibacter polytrichastri]|nr:hypothetical protein [Mucilaginibacter polytrichastri]
MNTEELFYERYILQIFRNVLSTDLKKNASGFHAETPFAAGLNLNAVELAYLYDLFEARVFFGFNAEERERLQSVRQIAQHMLNKQVMVNLEAV